MSNDLKKISTTDDATALFEAAVILWGQQPSHYADMVTDELREAANRAAATGSAGLWKALFCALCVLEPSYLKQYLRKVEEMRTAEPTGPVLPPDATQTSSDAHE